MNYSDFLQLEQFNNQKLGSFIPNSLFTRTAESADIKPSNREPWDVALPVHIHEYIHFLHNISTPSGIVFLFNGFNFFFEFMKGTDEHGIYNPAKHSPESAESFLKVYSLLKGGIVGAPPDKKIRFWKFGTPANKEVPLTILGHEFDTFSSTRIEVEATSHDNKLYNFTLEIGINFITEGIAYEIDREVRRKLQKWINLDEFTPPYPYLAYQPLIDYLVGRKTSIYERSILGTCALLEISPGKGLLRACAMLRSHKTTVSKGFCYYVAGIHQGLNGFRDDLQNIVFPNIILNFQGSPSLQAGVKEYLKFISVSFDKRCTTPLMELSFMHTTTRETFFKKVTELVPQWIYQEKLNGEAEISLIGHPTMVNAIDEAALSVLQSAFHYVQLHLRSNGTIMGTKEIPNVQCPFAGACQARVLSNDPEICIKAPWNIKFAKQNDIKNPTCFYSHGVKSLFYEKKYAT